MFTFKTFLINEEKFYLGHRVSDVLTALQELANDLEGMGVRQISRETDNIVSQLRKILHSQWSPRQVNYLKSIQKIAVALKKAIEEKGDLKELIAAATQELEKVSGQLGVPTNDIQPPQEPTEQTPPMDLTSNGPPKQPPLPGQK